MVGTELIDRTHELARLEALMLAATDGFAALEIAGAAGIGKTSLWAQARRMAEARGITVLSARPTETAAESSFGAVADLLFPADARLLEARCRSHCAKHSSWRCHASRARLGGRRIARSPPGCSP
jgi:hypothetical protein